MKDGATRGKTGQERSDRRIDLKNGARRGKSGARQENQDERRGEPGRVWGDTEDSRCQDRDKTVKQGQVRRGEGDGAGEELGQ